MTWQAPQYGIKGRQNQWINSIMASHDCWCGCHDPVYHLCKAAIKQGGIYNCNIQNLKKLLCQFDTTEEDGTKTHSNDTTKEDFDIDTGDLEKLFEQDSPLTENDDG